MKKVRVLPVYPAFPKATFWGFNGALPYIGKKSSMPPTGLLTVMAMVPPERFETQRVIDLNVEQLTDRQIKNADIIFTSSMIVQEASHREVVERAHFYGKKVVAGGPFPTSYLERNTGVDYLVTGEAEVTLAPFLEDLLNGTAQQIYTEKNVAGRRPVELTIGGKVKLHNTPLPRWDLIKIKKYASAAVQYSRGCPFDCDFCDITKLYGKEPRTKTPQQMVAEFEALRRAGHRGPVFVVDDNFIGNRANVRQMLPQITAYQQKHNFPFTLFTEASMNLAWPANQDILEGMVTAGFDTVFVGIESDDNDVLDLMHKGQNTKISQLKGVRTMQNAGLEVIAGFIIGLDGEKPDATEKLYNFIQESGIVMPMPGLLTALKGTDLYKRLEREGRLRGESHGNNTHKLGFNFIPGRDEATIIREYKHLLERLFDQKNYHARDKVLQENLGSKVAGRKIDFQGVLALGKSMKNHLFASGGLEYARHLYNTARRRPSYLSEAVAKEIKLEHFQKITRAMLEADAYMPHTETLFEQFRARATEISHRYGENIQAAKKQIYRTAQKVITQAERKLDRLHEDFRDGPLQAFHDFRKRVHEEIHRYVPTEIA